MKVVGTSLLVLAATVSSAVWQSGSLAVVQLGDGISPPSSSAAEVRIVELNRADGTLTGSTRDVTYVGASGIAIGGTTSTEGGMNVFGLEAYIGGYQVAPGSSTSGADRRVQRLNLITGAVTGSSDLPAALFTAVIRDSGPYGGEAFALATNQGVQTGTFGSGTASNASGSDTNVRFVSGNHGLFAYSISTGGNYRVKEIGNSNILLDVSSEAIIVADHAISSDGLTLYLASDSTSVGGLWRFSRPNTSTQFSVPGVRIFTSQLRHIALYETGGSHQVFASYKSGASSWVYGFLTADTAPASSAADWSTMAPANTMFAGLGVASASASLSGQVSLSDWVGGLAGRSMNFTITPVNSSTVIHSGSVTLDGSGGYSLPLSQAVVAGSYDCYADSSLFLKRKISSVTITSSGASGVNFVLANGDVDDSGEVDAADIDAVIAEFGSTSQGINEDVDGSGEVDAADIDIVISSFGSVDD